MLMLMLTVLFKLHVFLCLQLDQWPRFIAARFQYTIYPITFSVGDAEEWKKLFKPCAAQRLFLPVRPPRLPFCFKYLCAH